MKRILVVLLNLLFALSLSSCYGNEGFIGAAEIQGHRFLLQRHTYPQRSGFK